MNRISVDQALNIISQAVSRLAPVWLPAREALGCQLAGDIVATLDHPPFARSPLDGYAVRAADIEQADAKTPVRLNVTDRSYAGIPAQKEIDEGEAIRIMTGGAFPRGADCVIRQEDTDLGESEVQIFARSGSRNNICAVGEDFHNGETLVPAGELVTAATIALAIAAGCETLFVFPKASAAILATGEELCEPGKPLRYGQIYDSNTPYLAARLSELRVPVAQSARALDRLEDIAQNLLALLEEADVVFTTGGVSVGERDLLPETIAHIGGEILFHGGRDQARHANVVCHGAGQAGAWDYPAIRIRRQWRLNSSAEQYLRMPPETTASWHGGKRPSCPPNTATAANTSAICAAAGRMEPSRCRGHRAMRIYNRSSRATVWSRCRRCRRRSNPVPR